MFIITITLPFLVYASLVSPPCFVLSKDGFSELDSVIQTLTPSSVNVALEKMENELIVAYIKGNDWSSV